MPIWILMVFDDLSRKEGTPSVVRQLSLSLTMTMTMVPVWCNRSQAIQPHQKHHQQTKKTPESHIFLAYPHKKMWKGKEKIEVEKAEWKEKGTDILKPGFVSKCNLVERVFTDVATVFFWFVYKNGCRRRLPGYNKKRIIIVIVINSKYLHFSIPTCKNWLLPFLFSFFG